MQIARRSQPSWLLPTIAALAFFSTTTSAASSAAASTTALPNLSSAISSKSVAATATTATDSATDSAGSTITGSAASGTTAAAATSNGLTLPTLSATGGTYTSVSVSVPPTANAPYMHVSNMPEGTVFIAVGAILGFFAMSVLLWRGLVAWSLHRSVKRANMEQYMSMDAKANFRAPAAPFYKYSDRDSMISLSGLPSKGGKKGPRPQSTAAATAPANPSSLFFSPTAGAVGNNAGNRGSTYLPAGYYAAGAPAGNSPYDSTISMTTLDPRPQSQGGYERTPSMGPSYYNPNGASSSTLNLNQAPGNQRTPSVYLDDLFDSNNGGPPLPPPHNNHRQSGQHV
ncbi:hypothetical protein BP5796_07559 [Coleophoma crateriformis]|uniref:Uncharacterized protein n=1 Tax=Coleophoma crateriformis TaxID=565419 RepID=A0A3D8RJ93_9HELO|nr:hypothetical protein BP5796_07559 [Coleophoma crateriformis]